MSQPFSDEQLRRIEQLQHLRSVYRWPAPAPQPREPEPAQPATESTETTT